MFIGLLMNAMISGVPTMLKSKQNLYRVPNLFELLEF